VRLEPFFDFHLDIAVWRRLPIRHMVGRAVRPKAVNGHRAALCAGPLIGSIEQPPIFFLELVKNIPLKRGHNGWKFGKHVADALIGLSIPPASDQRSR
jgi:hypothetical protein